MQTSDIFDDVQDTIDRLHATLLTQAVIDDRLQQWKLLNDTAMAMIAKAKADLERMREAIGLNTEIR